VPPRRPRQAPTPALDALGGGEHARVLEALLVAHPDLRTEAEEAARGLLGSATIESVAEDVAWAIDAISIEDLASRSGRVRGRGYVHENEAAWELLSETVEPFMADLRRRAGLGLTDAAAAVAAGIVSGLYQSRQPDDGTVAAYAGPDAPGELADEALREADRLGVTPPPQTADDHWPEWSEHP
jgi:hypothetical protein